jgi:ribosomal-protein-alanine N-acetyltransferase
MTPSQMAAIHALIFTLPRPWAEAEFEGLLTSPLVFALTEDAGFLLGRVVAGEAELLTLAVAPDQWGKGIGGRLVDAFIRTAKIRGGESAFLEVASLNQRAQGLYAKKGFVPQGRRKGYYSGSSGIRDDALILVRLI